MELINKKHVDVNRTLTMMMMMMEAKNEFKEKQTSPYCARDLLSESNFQINYIIQPNYNY